MLMELLFTSVAAVLAVYVLVKITCPWIKYDIQYILESIKVIKKIKKKIDAKELSVNALERQARERPNQTFIIYQDNNYSYEFVDKKSNQVARAGLELGLKVGDVATIMMLNEPAFVWTLFGLHKIGVSVSLINYHLRHKSLIHSINSCKPKVLIVGQGEELMTALTEIKDELGDTRVLSHDTESEFESFGKYMNAASSDPIDYKYRAEVKLSDVGTFIFTSGTTGLPKPAIVNQKRMMMAQVAFSGFHVNRNDILYETLPLYHSAGLCLGILGIMDVGGIVVLRTKFSASNFWNDCRNHNVTVIHYIGEMCRYLINKPESPDDGRHNIRVAVGNGLRVDIWEEFQSRFKIPEILEFYAATESPVSFMNIFNIVGPVGRSSPVTRILFPAAFVQFDHATQTVKRDANGRCIRTGRDNVGLLICPIDKIRTFDGYHKRPADNEKKLLRDVFKPGDLYFNTGDVFYVDNEYFVYFRDRTGDTFRWKGENVSTNEVANILSTVGCVHDANVYGVTVPGCEGRAGMAAIHLKEGATLDSNGLDDIKTQCEQHLPTYARPKFLRVQRQMSLTSTYKQQKFDLVNESFDPHKANEPMYYLDNKSNHYEPINESVFEDIVAGRITV